MKGVRLCEGGYGLSETQGIQKKIFLMNALDIKMSSGNTGKTSNSISNDNANKN